jgi:hypothetical protein
MAAEPRTIGRARTTGVLVTKCLIYILISSGERSLPKNSRVHGDRNLQTDGPHRNQFLTP